MGKSNVPKKRHELAKSQGWRCCYCGNLFTKTGTPGAATLEHVKPKMDGGTNARENLAAACFKCNQDLGRRMNMAKQQNEKALAAQLTSFTDNQVAEYLKRRKHPSFGPAAESPECIHCGNPYPAHEGSHGFCNSCLD